MRDQDDRLSSIPKTFDDLQKELDLLWGKQCGRLIENQDFSFTVQHLQDLHPLLNRNINIRDHFLWIYFKSVLSGKAGNLLICPFNVNIWKNPQCFFHRLDPHDNILCNRIIGNQFKMLMYHPDIQLGSISWGTDDLFLSPDIDLPFVWFIHAEKHAHQRRLPCTILTKDRIDLSLFDLNGHILIGNDPGKTLGNMPHFHNVICHASSSF